MSLNKGTHARKVLLHALHGIHILQMVIMYAEVVTHGVRGLELPRLPRSKEWRNKLLNSWTMLFTLFFLWKYMFWLHFNTYISVCTGRELSSKS